VVAHESTAPEALLALARIGHGVAILPTTARLDGEKMRALPLMLRGRAMAMDLVMLWNAGRVLPAYGRAFIRVLGEHARETIPKLPAAGRARRGAKTGVATEP
jgi:DNA-binding transcriptional LysR family regulator